MTKTEKAEQVYNDAKDNAEALYRRNLAAAHGMPTAALRSEFTEAAEQTLARDYENAQRIYRRVRTS